MIRMNGINMAEVNQVSIGPIFCIDLRIDLRTTAHAVRSGADTAIAVLNVGHPRKSDNCACAFLPYKGKINSF